MTGVSRQVFYGALGVLAAIGVTILIILLGFWIVLVFWDR